MISISRSAWIHVCLGALFVLPLPGCGQPNMDAAGIVTITVRWLPIPTSQAIYNKVDVTVSGTWTMRQGDIPRTAGVTTFPSITQQGDTSTQAVQGTTIALPGLRPGDWSFTVRANALSTTAVGNVPLQLVNAGTCRVEVFTGTSHDITYPSPDNNGRFPPSISDFRPCTCSPSCSR
jgi:hypothetical protein